MADGISSKRIDRLTAITAPRAQNVIVILRTNIQEVYGLIIKSGTAKTVAAVARTTALGLIHYHNGWVKLI